jgi:hypothetical protein
MTLATMRQNGVCAVTATCEACGRSADVVVDALPETVTVAKAGQRRRCSQCGGKATSIRPASTALVVPENRAVAAHDSCQVVPAIIAAAGDKAARRYIEFFAVTIENANTRAACFHACRRFFAWCDDKGLDELVAIEPMHRPHRKCDVAHPCLADDSTACARGRG